MKSRAIFKLFKSFGDSLLWNFLKSEQSDNLKVLVQIVSGSHSVPCARKSLALHHRE